MQPNDVEISNFEFCRSNNLKLKNLTPQGCKDKGIKKYEFMAKTLLLYVKNAYFNKKYKREKSI